MNSPKILIWDIEITHNIVAKFGLQEEWIASTNILQESYIVCAAWKWLGEKKVHSISVLDDPKLYAKDPHNDAHVVKKLHEVLSEADVIVAHNGDKFDLKFTEGRIIIHNLTPLPPLQKVDTLKVAKKRFKFNANNLNYLGKILGVGQKIKTDSGLWLQVLNGDSSAIKKMETYNRGDVELLEKVFKKLQPYIPNHPLKGNGVSECPRCASKKVQSRGFAKTMTRVYRRFQCQDCGGWFRLLKSETSIQKVRSI